MASGAIIFQLNFLCNEVLLRSGYVSIDNHLKFDLARTQRFDVLITFFFHINQWNVFIVNLLFMLLEKIYCHPLLPLLLTPHRM